MSSVTQFCSEDDFPIRIYPIVGKLMNVPSKCLAAIKKRDETCFQTGTMFAMAIWTIKSGSGIPLMRAIGCVLKIRRSSFSHIALLKTPVSRSPFFRIVRTTEASQAFVVVDKSESQGQIVEYQLCQIYSTWYLVYCLPVMGFFGLIITLCGCWSALIWACRFEFRVTVFFLDVLRFCFFVGVLVCVF